MAGVKTTTTRPSGDDPGRSGEIVRVETIRGETAKGKEIKKADSTIPAKTK
jgi:hypothetical protein